MARNDEALRAYDRTYAAAETTGFLAAKAYALIGKANVFVRMDDYTQGQRNLGQAVELMRGKVPEAHSAQIRLNMTQARIDAAQGRLESASKTFSRMIELLEARGASGPALASAYRLRGEVEAQQGKRAEALMDAEKAVQVAEGLQGGKQYSDDAGLAYLSLGRVLRAAGERERAKTALQTAVAHLSNSVGADHPDTRAAQSLL